MINRHSGNGESNNAGGETDPLCAQLASENESVWIRIGKLSEAMNEGELASYAYENVLRHNSYNVRALTQVASLCRVREQYSQAVSYFRRILEVDETNGDIWSELGHCYLMTDELQMAYTAYQNALYHLKNPKDTKLWYGIGILYDRYGSFEHAEEAFTAVLKLAPQFEKAHEIFFRLGIIYKQQGKYKESLESLNLIVNNPPAPLTQADVHFQIGHVYELQKDYEGAKRAYEHVLQLNPNHAKVLQQLGWLYHHNPAWGDQKQAISYLMRSIDADEKDGQTWYLLGRCFMSQQQFKSAYDAYQRAVMRDNRNPTFWCSIGVLYYQINQFSDALDAYTRAIHLNPLSSEVWYDLGTLYESCKQVSDALDAYAKASELDPSNEHIKERLSMLRSQSKNPGSLMNMPKPVPTHPPMGNMSMGVPLKNSIPSVNASGLPFHGSREGGDDRKLPSPSSDSHS